MTDELSLLAVVLVFAPLLVLWVLALFHIVARRPDLSVAGKAIWLAIVVFAAYLGLLLYAGLRPPRSPQATGKDDEAAKDALTRLATLVDDHAAGALDDREFAREKAAVFGLEAPTA